jgi:hypothetical protein
LKSDHIFIVGDDFSFVPHCVLIAALFVHGTVPDCFQSSTITLFPKGLNANTSDSANFRGIALSSLCGKILDNSNLVRYFDKPMTNELQTGFNGKALYESVFYSLERNHIVIVLQTALNPRALYVT